MRRISHRKRSEDRREYPFKFHLCGYPNSAVLPLLGRLEAMNVKRRFFQPVGGHAAQFVDEGQGCRHARR